jgi:hypothetical protein
VLISALWTKTFLLSTLPYTTLLPPLILTLVVRPLSLGRINYLPSGPTATIFALLAQYHASIPSTYRYTISTSTPSTPTPAAPTSASSQPNPPPQTFKKSLTISLSDKSTTYLVATQLALSQFPYMLLPGVIGWIVGTAWRADVLPLAAGSGSSAWRVPGWVFGEEGSSFSISRLGRGEGEASGGFESLRRRLENEAAAAASGNSTTNGGTGSRQRVVRDD